MKQYTLYEGDCLQVMPHIESGSVNLIATDPPYFKVKDNDWDRQWATADAFLSWIDDLCMEWKRVLAPNGSLYVFASPQMAWHVESVIRRHFSVINHVIWKKDGGTRAAQSDKDVLRGFFGDSERIIFAEQYHALVGDDELNGEVFRPLKSWFRSKAKVYSISNKQLNTSLGYASNGGGVACDVVGDKSRFIMPTETAYRMMQNCFPGVFDADYDVLRSWYERLKTDFENSRRPFNATADAPYTDVWAFPTVGTYPGKHPAEKPLDLMRHIVRVSSRPGDVVLDSFMGSGTTGHAAATEGRRFIGIEKDGRWFSKAQKRAAAAYGDWQTAQQVRTIQDVSSHTDLPLFAGLSL